MWQCVCGSGTVLGVMASCQRFHLLFCRCEVSLHFLTCVHSAAARRPIGCVGHCKPFHVWFDRESCFDYWPSPFSGALERPFCNVLLRRCKPCFSLSFSVLSLFHFLDLSLSALVGMGSAANANVSRVPKTQKRIRHYRTSTTMQSHFCVLFRYIFSLRHIQWTGQEIPKSKQFANNAPPPLPPPASHHIRHLHLHFPMRCSQSLP
jgi:hypothetical protein